MTQQVFVRGLVVIKNNTQGSKLKFFKFFSEFDLLQKCQTIGQQLKLDCIKDLKMVLTDRNDNKKFRSFKSKENIHKKEVGPYHGFGY